MQSSYREVLRCLLEGVQWLLDPSAMVKVAGKSGISQARTRLGASLLLIGFGQDPISDGIVIAMAFVTAAVVLLVDIQIVQADFYLHGLELARDRGLESGSFIWVKIRRPTIVILRLGLSITIAFAFAAFFELRLFGSDIIRRIDDDHRTANARFFQEVRASYDARVIQLSTEITNDEKAQRWRIQRPWKFLFNTSDADPEIKGLVQKLARLESAKETTDIDVLRRGGDAVDELNGVRETADQSGRPGDGPRHRPPPLDSKNTPGSISPIRVFYYHQKTETSPPNFLTIRDSSYRQYYNEIRTRTFR
jgi:hypothetical protein